MANTVSEIRCDVVDAGGKVIIYEAEICNFVTKDYRGKTTHITVQYFKNFEDALAGTDVVYQIFPLDRVFFYDPSERLQGGISCAA